jgi:Na+/melibiose symporter-like transporter
MTNNSSNDKPVRTVSFVVHATRGLIRDRQMRRKTMFFLLIGALVLLFCGSTLLQSILNPRERPGWFIFFWAVCAWLALTAMLLAVFDLMMLRAEARKAQRTLHEKIAQSQTADRPGPSADD